MLKKIIKNLKPSSTLRINEISNKLQSEGKKIYKFGFGQSPFEVPDDVVSELKNNAHQNKYLSMQGLSEQGMAKVSIQEGTINKWYSNNLFVKNGNFFYPDKYFGNQSAISGINITINIPVICSAIKGSTA